MNAIIGLTMVGACLAVVAMALVLGVHVAPFRWLRNRRHGSYIVLLPLLFIALAFVPLVDLGPKGGGWMLVWWAYPMAGLYFFSSGPPDFVSVVAHIIIVVHHALAVGLALLPGFVFSRKTRAATLPQSSESP